MYLNKQYLDDLIQSCKKIDLQDFTFSDQTLE